MLVLCASAAVAHAQAGPRTGGPAPGDYNDRELSADVAVTGNVTRGLFDHDYVSARGAFNFWDGPWGLFVQPYYLYGDVKLSDALPRVETDDERFVRAIVFRQLTRPLFAFGLAGLDHSLRRRIDRRTYLVTGLGATLVNRPGLTFLTSVGIGGEFTDFDGNTLPDMTMVAPSTRDVARASLRLYGRYKLFGGHLALLHDLYVRANARDVSDTNVLFSGTAEVPLAWGLSARVQLDASHEAHIVPGTEHDDLALTFGAAYRGDWKLARAAPAPAPPADTGWQR